MHRLPLRRSLCCAAVWTVLAAAIGLACRAENWTRFRGYNGSGVSDEQGFPSQWNAGRLSWKVDLPGVGHSCPVIWEKKLFLTSANDDGTERYLLCLDAETGRLIWKEALKFDTNAKHLKNSWASSTPAVDGQLVFAVFADVEKQILYAYNFDGKQIWAKTIGGFESQHGQGASPIVFEDLVILANDQDGPSSIVALDKRTGKEVWSVKRKSGAQTTAYSTPMIYHPKEGPPQLICSSGPSGVSALDVRTGDTIWTTGSLPARTVSSPVLASGLILQCCGGGGQGKLLVAVDPSGKGNVSKTHVRYERKQILPYVPTPIASGNNVFLWGDHGIVCCMNALTGKDLWTKRIGGEFSSSPICTGGMLFNVDERGNVIVLTAGPQYKPLGQLPLADASHSTPAVANGRIYFRTFHHLACVEARP